MKKLLAAIAMVGAVATASFALTFKASAGFAYGFTDIYQTYSGTVVTSVFPFTETHEFKSETINNSLGFKLEGALGLTKDFGFKSELSFLFPMNGTTFQITDVTANSKGDPTILNYDGSFIFNGFVGPYYSFGGGKAFSFDVAAGFDIGVNNYTTKSSSSTNTKSYALIGIGANADAQLLVTKHAGIKFGLTFAFLWGNQYISVTADNNGSHTDTEDYVANAIYLIPDVSFVYKF